MVIGVFSGILTKSVNLAHVSELPADLCTHGMSKEDSASSCPGEISACEIDDASDSANDIENHIDSDSFATQETVAQDKHMNYSDRLFSHTLSCDSDPPLIVATVRTENCATKSFVDVGRDIGVKIATDSLTKSRLFTKCSCYVV